VSASSWSHASAVAVAPTTGPAPDSPPSAVRVPRKVRRVFLIAVVSVFTGISYED